MGTLPYLVRRARAAGVADPRVLGALAGLQREDFVPPAYAREADIDEPIPTMHGQVTSQPSLIAKMVEALELTGDERVLEVGTGFGFQTALLAALARRVFSVERDADIAAVARANLERATITNAGVVTGDGSAGLATESPFDAIIVSAAFPAVPAPLAEQLAVGGRLIQPVGPGGREEVVLFTKTAEGLQRIRVVSGARFVRLVGQYAFDR